MAVTEPTPATYGLSAVERRPVLAPGPKGTFGVVEALCKVMLALPNIGKGDRSPEGYSYRGIEAITRHVQQLFGEHGIVTIPNAEVLFTVPSPAMKEGWQDVAMRVEWTIASTDGSTITATTNGIGRDKSDKGSNKAQTQALKYLLLPVLLIADGKDDADGQSYEDGHAADPRPVETFVAPTGEVIEVWPGEVSVHAAKVVLLDAVGGDREAAAKAWAAAGFEGRWKLRRDELEPLLLLMRGGSKDTKEGAGVDGPASGGDAAQSGDGADSQDVGRTEPESAPAAKGKGGRRGSTRGTPQPAEPLPDGDLVRESFSEAIDQGHQP